MKVCPICGSRRVIYSGMRRGWIFPLPHTAERFFCKTCRYEGSVILEVSNKKDVKKIKEHYRKLLKNYLINHRKITQPIFTRKWLWLWKILTFIFFAYILLLLLLWF